MFFTKEVELKSGNRFMVNELSSAYVSVSFAFLCGVFMGDSG